MIEDDNECEFDESSMEELEEALRQMHGEDIKIIWPEEDWNPVLQPYIEEILEALGHSEALISSKTTINHFVSALAEDDEEEMVFEDTALELAEDLSDELGVEVDPEDTIVSIARRVKDSRD